MNNLPTCPNIKYLRLVAKNKELLWKDVNLPQELQDLCIAYCIREGDTFRIGRPSKNAIIFIFPNGTVYDISLLLHDKYCWRAITPESLKWIKDRSNKEHTA